MRDHSLHGTILAMLLCAVVASCGDAVALTLAPWKMGRTPVLVLKDMREEQRTLAEFRGKVVVVNFWATWCEPCIEEMPALQKFQERVDDGSLVVLGVNLGEGESRIKAFTEKTGTNFMILLDRDGVAKKNWRVNGVPATFVLDTKGQIRYSHVGVLDFSDATVTDKILRLLPQKKQTK